MIHLRTFVLSLLSSITLVTAQSLDWSADMTLFGTGDDELRPVLISFQNSHTLRALCVRNSSQISSRVTTDLGANWSLFADLSTELSYPVISAVSMNSYSNIFIYSIGSAQRTLYRFNNFGNNWNDASAVSIASDRTGRTLSAAVCSDVLLQPADPYLNICWTEYDSNTENYQAAFTQSRDNAVTFTPAQVVFTYTNQEFLTAEIALAVTGNSEAQRLVLAAPVDGPGSIPAQIHIFHSENQGETWSGGTIIDITPYLQDDPAFFASGDTLLLAYSRRIAQESERNVFLTYSFDGGLTFDPPVAVFSTSQNERTPRFGSVPGSGIFSLFCLSGSTTSGEGAVLKRDGWLDSPWDLGDTLRISGNDRVSLTGGLSVASSPSGIAACWSSRFELGDLDVRFDASWRGNHASDLSALYPAQFTVGSCYPNPFNPLTNLPLTVNREGSLHLTVTDLLGRQIWQQDLTGLTAGQHTIQLDLREQSSGIYFARVENNSETFTRKLVLLK